ncbi:MAG: isochorismatase family protein [Actinomycetia bacterium]|nr:isochorismatase family protein [Actinomycetes bacterium]
MSEVIDLSALDSGSAALLVIDMQNAFCHPEGTLGDSGVDVSPVQEVYGPLGELIGAFKGAGIPVIWTVQAHLQPDHGREQKRLPSHTERRSRVAALAGSWDAQIVEELADLADDSTMVVRKHRLGAFYETRLEALLRMLGVRTLFITGVTLNACVETTVREAYLRDYDVVAVTDCIAGVRPQWEPSALEVWSHYLAHLATSGEVAQWLEESSRPVVKGIRHVLLETTDLDAAERFYVDLLGFKVKNRAPFRDGRRFIGIEQGLWLTEGGTGEGGQGDHFAFEVEGVAEFERMVAEAGYRIVRPLGPGPYGLTVYVADPDGNEIELYETEKT